MESQGVGEKEEEEITEEQRKRAEANRLAALSKRKAIVSGSSNGFQSASWKFFKCRKLSSGSVKSVVPNPSVYPSVKCVDASNSKPEMPPPVTELFRVRLEISSPDSFSVAPMPIPGVPYPGDETCLEKLSDLLSCV